MAEINEIDNEKHIGGEPNNLTINEKKNDSASAVKEEEMDFASLIDLYDKSTSSFDEGEVVEGKVISVSDSEVLVDIGYKSEGVIPLDEFTDAQGNVRVNTGDLVEVLIELKEDRRGRVKLSHRKAASMKVWDRIETAHQKDEIIKGKVIERVKGGLAVDVGIRAFLPGSLIDTHPVKNLDALIGDEIDVKVIKVNKKRGNIVLSRKIILDEKNKLKKAETLKTLKEGDLIKGIVKNITSYGAFIDLGGIDGLLHITDMSWGRINHPSELFVLGDEVEVQVLSFDREEEKVSLGYKQKTTDPWEGVEEKYPVGSKIKGKVVSITDYGAFVEIKEGVEGLIHVSEMSWDKKVKHPSKILKTGDITESVVLEIDKGNRKISLGLKQMESNPWEKIAEKYEVGSNMEGKVRNITSFGAFVTIEDGIDGLIHVSDISYTKRINHPSEVLKKGDVVKTRILNIDPENQQISLGLKQLTSDAWDEFFETHSVGSLVSGKVTRITNFGAFVEVADDVEGLIHVSELDTKKVEKPEDVLTLNESYKMKIINLDREEKKIGLSIRALKRDQAKQARVAKKKTPKPKKKAKAEKRSNGGINIGDLVGDQLSTLKEMALGVGKKKEAAEEEAENGHDAAPQAETEAASGNGE